MRQAHKEAGENPIFAADGKEGMPVHIVYAGELYDVSESELWKDGVHMGFDHAQWEMWSGSKYGVTYLMNRSIEPVNKNRAPRCQTCHMPDGNHRVFSAWGFLAVQLLEEDKEWIGYRATILKGLGVLDPDGNPTPRLDIIKAGKVARLTKEDFQSERERYTEVCIKCHSPYFVQENMKRSNCPF